MVAILAAPMSSAIRYARSGDVNIAYQVTGEGPFDLVLVPGFFSHLEIGLGAPAATHASSSGSESFARLICFDKRGTGLSDRGVGLPDFETRMDDVRAVMDAAGSETRGPPRLLRGRPDVRPLRGDATRSATRSLVLYGTYAKRRDPDEDYPWAPTREERERTSPAELERGMGRRTSTSRRWHRAPTRSCAPGFERLGRAARQPCAVPAT